MKTNQKKLTNTILIGIIVILLGIGGYFVWSKKTNTTITNLPLPPATSQIDTSNWKTYRNDKYGFELVLTDAWKGYRVYTNEFNNIFFDIPFSDSDYPIFPNNIKVYPWHTPLVIQVYSLDEWAKFQHGVNTQGAVQREIFQQNSKYIFTVTTSIPKSGKDKFEVLKVLSTFKFTNSDLSQNICELINNSIFVSINKYNVGMWPNGPVEDNWEINFKNGKFEWLEKEVGGGNGTYSCVGANVQGMIKGSDRAFSFSGNYDFNKKVLTWDGVEYKKIK